MHQRREFSHFLQLSLEGCEEFNFLRFFDAISCTLISVFITLVLSFLRQKSSNTRLSLVAPLNILDGQLRNRWSVAIAFATMMSTISGLLLGHKFHFIQIDDERLHNISALLNLIITVVTYFVVYYPYLACLMSEHCLIASILGFLYVSYRYIILAVGAFQCWIYSKSLTNEQEYFKFVLELPVIVFNAFLFARFAFLVGYHTWHRVFRSHLKTSQYKIVEESTLRYVYFIFHPRKRSRIESKNIYGIVSILYGDCNFKFSSLTISTFLVSFLAVFYTSVVIVREICSVELFQSNPFDVVIKTPTITSVCVAAFFTSGMLIDSMLCHRRNILRMFKGDKTFLPENLGRPSRIVGRSLRFCGNQVAAACWGNITVSSLFIIISCTITTLVHFWEEIFTPERIERARQDMIFVLLPCSIYYIAIWFFIELLVKFVFRNFSYPDNVITIDNRKVYNTSIFFFYFHTIIVGFPAVVGRTILSIFLGLFFLSRTDRNLMIQGFHNVDHGYASYVGYLHVIAIHRNPVRIVFSQILLDLVHKQNVIVNKRVYPYPRVSRKAFNRWHLAYTLIKNSQLQQYRIHRFVDEDRR
ncbi:stimulated by retinoic acid gene 6 protein-like [Xenia sp. Carnegie-2017]|uniref:stimulated by retinoic acid gene 6 protein-like n=1 Tax=Xenia sp. Carnegie-2017 TaxID=2897299 RepID=UPI001F0425DE|nr:stimulated by retinoic acid gene 6 protein-like [Xenia sp. Carnegie-2017]